jgi:hypothetical protein
MFISETFNTVHETSRSSEQGLITGRGTADIWCTRENCLVHKVQTLSSALLSSGYRRSFLGIKRPGRKADHSPESSVEIKTKWSWTLLSPSHKHAYLLTYSLTYSLTCLLTYLLIHLITYSLTYSLTYFLTHLLACLLTYLLTYTLHAAQSFLRRFYS